MRACFAPLLAFAFLLQASSAAAATWFVQVGGTGFAYAPQVLTIRTGDTVVFRNLGGYHNVVADDGAFRCAQGCDGDGQGGSGDASFGIWRATVTFPKAGTFGYFCEPHGAPGEGMFGTVIVEAPPPPIEVPLGARALALLAAAVLCSGVLLARLRVRP